MAPDLDDDHPIESQRQWLLVVPTASYADALHGLSALELDLVSGWELPVGVEDRPGVLCHGTVHDRPGARAAATAALAGRSVLVGASPELRAELATDLARLGPVIELVPGDDLSDRELDLLEAQLDGDRLPQAALAARVSQRTAERAMHGLRSRYHVRSTAELMRLLAPSLR